MASKAHRAEVFRVTEVLPHPNADRLEVIKPWGYQCVVQKGINPVGALRVYIPPHNVLPDTEQFAWVKEAGLKEGSKNPLLLRAKRLRGYVSMGIIIPTPDGAQEGDDVTEQLGITAFEPEQSADAEGTRVQPAGLYEHHEDIDPLRRFLHVFEPGEPVYVSEKIHGQNVRVLYHDDKLFVGTRTQWLEESDKLFCWRAARNSPGLVEKAQANPGHIFYGEGVPCQKGFLYGHTADDPRVYVYDVVNAMIGEPLSVEPFFAMTYGLDTAPCIAKDFPFDYEELQKLANGPSCLTAPPVMHTREGVVVKPMVERTHPEINRVILKLHGSDFLGEG